MSPYKFIIGYQPRTPIDLVRLSIDSKLCEVAQLFVQYIQDFQDEFQ